MIGVDSERGAVVGEDAGVPSQPRCRRPRRHRLRSRSPSRAPLDAVDVEARFEDGKADVGGSPTPVEEVAVEALVSAMAAKRASTALLTAASLALSWLRLTASVPEVPAATLVTWRWAEVVPTETTLARPPSLELAPRATLLAPVEVAKAPRASEPTRLALAE